MARLTQGGPTSDCSFIWPQDSRPFHFTTVPPTWPIQPASLSSLILVNSISPLQGSLLDRFPYSYLISLQAIQGQKSNNEECLFLSSYFIQIYHPFLHFFTWAELFVCILLCEDLQIRGLSVDFPRKLMLSQNSCRKLTGKWRNQNWSE